MGKRENKGVNVMTNEELKTAYEELAGKYNDACENLVTQRDRINKLILENRNKSERLTDFLKIGTSPYKLGKLKNENYRLHKKVCKLKKKADKLKFSLSLCKA